MSLNTTAPRKYLVLFITVLYCSLLSNVHGYFQYLDTEKPRILKQLNARKTTNPHMILGQIEHSFDLIKSKDDITDTIRKSALFQVAKVFGALHFQNTLVPDVFEIPYFDATKTRVTVAPLGPIPTRLILSSIIDHGSVSQTLKRVLRYEGLIVDDESGDEGGKDDGKDEEREDEKEDPDNNDDGNENNEDTNSDEDDFREKIIVDDEFFNTGLEWDLKRKFISKFKQTQKDVDISTTRKEFVRDFIKDVWTSYAGQNEPNNGSDSANCLGSSGIAYESSISNKLINCEASKPEGLTLVNSLDTLLLAGLTSEYKQGISWVKDMKSKILFSSSVSLFEAHSSYLGSLLSVYELYPEDQSIILPELQYFGPLLRNSTGLVQPALPGQMINFITKKQSFGGDHSLRYTLSELSAPALEHSRLSKVLNDKSYDTFGSNVLSILNQFSQDHAINIPPRILTGRKASDIKPFVLPIIPAPIESVMTFESLGAGYPVALLRYWILHGRQAKHNRLREKFEKFMDQWIFISKLDCNDETCIFGNKKTLINGVPVQLVDGIDQYSYSPTSQKYVLLESCSAGGLLALGVASGALNPNKNYLELAEKITRTCLKAYSLSKTGVAPSKFDVSSGKVEFSTSSEDPDYGEVLPNLSLPRASNMEHQAIESAYIMYKVTGNKFYQHKCYAIAKSLKKSHFTKDRNGLLGYFPLKDVTDPKSQNGQMNVKFIGSTLKYLYLAFDEDSKIQLDTHVFTVNNNPLKIEEVAN